MVLTLFSTFAYQTFTKVPCTVIALNPTHTFALEALTLIHMRHWQHKDNHKALQYLDRAVQQGHLCLLYQV